MSEKIQPDDDNKGAIITIGKHGRSVPADSLAVEAARIGVEMGMGTAIVIDVTPGEDEDGRPIRVNPVTISEN